MSRHFEDWDLRRRRAVRGSVLSGLLVIALCVAALWLLVRDL
jgi:hypothetical protein